MAKSLEDGLGDGRRSRSFTQDGNGLPLTPQLVLTRESRRHSAILTNNGPHTIEVELGDPLEGWASPDFQASFELYPNETAFLEFEPTRGRCEWTGSVWTGGRSVGDYLVVCEVLLEP